VLFHKISNDNQVTLYVACLHDPNNEVKKKHKQVIISILYIKSFFQINAQYFQWDNFQKQIIKLIWRNDKLNPMMHLFIYCWHHYQSVRAALKYKRTLSKPMLRYRFR